MALKVHNDYDPTYNYDYIYKTIVHNVNLLSKHDGLHQTGYYTSWAIASTGEKGDGIKFRVQINTVFKKGGQTVLACDSCQFCPHAYIQRHKLHWNT